MGESSDTQVLRAHFCPKIHPIYQALSGLVGYLAISWGGALIGALIAGSFLVFAVGLSRGQLEKRPHRLPNQGIRRSARNGLFFGLLTSLFFAVLCALFLSPSTALLSRLLVVLFVALLTGLIAGLYTGLIVCIQHIAIRILLWRANAAPLRYVRFLDEAVRCIVLRRVGGGYIFIHRLLLDYFAALDEQALRALPANPASA